LRSRAAAKPVPTAGKTSYRLGIAKETRAGQDFFIIVNFLFTMTFSEVRARNDSAH
jgi:hypothetical protein